MPSFIDLTGQVFNNLTVLYRAGSCASGATWVCQCACGSVVTVPACNLKSGNIRSCGCSRVEDLTGQRFGDLVVIKRSSVKRDKTYWSCECACGRIFDTRSDGLKSGKTVSCGCHRIKIFVNRNTRHGLSYTKEYGAYTAVKRRERKKKLDGEWIPEMERFLRRLYPMCVVCNMTEKEHYEKYNCALNVDHVHALSNGGALAPGNCTILCRRCNGIKWKKDVNDLPDYMRDRILVTADLFELLWNATQGN